MPTSEQEKIIDRLRKLKAHADSAKSIGSEAEAQAFAAMLQNLLTKHNLEMSDVAWEQNKEESASIKIWRRADGRKIREWAFYLADAIAKGNFCRCFIIGHGLSVQFIGSVANTEVCAQTMDYMHAAAKRLVGKEERNRRKQMMQENISDFIIVSRLKGYNSSFLLGFVTRLAARLEEEKTKMQQANSTTTALVRIHHSLRLANDYVANQVVSSVKTRNTKFNSEAYADGQRRANDVNIGGNKLN